jgi:Zn-finger nucleic acid-binding protein
MANCAAMARTRTGLTDGMSHPACPACEGETALVGWADVYGFECQHCRGHFIRSNALAAFLTKNVTAHRYLEHLERTRASPHSRRALKCPDCGIAVYRAMHIEVIEYDACAGCGGVYLDQDEALHYLEHVRSAPPPVRHPATFAARLERDADIIELMSNLFFGD